MNLKAGSIGFILLLAGVGAVHSQSLPSVAAAWGEMKLSQAECLKRGVQVMEQLRYKRIEAISYTVYGDFEKFQLGIRCVPDKQMYFVFGGGPGEDEKPLLTQINAVKDALDR